MAKFGGFGGGNMQQLMRQAQKMQQEMMEAQEELKTIEVTGALYMVSIIIGTMSITSGLNTPMFFTICRRESLIHIVVPKENPLSQSITRQ